MEETKNLTAKIGDEQRAFQTALSRPAVMVLLTWHASDSDGKQPHFDVLLINCGNGPAHLARIEIHVDGQEIPILSRSDYALIARRLFEERCIRDCSGLVSFGDYWLAAGRTQRLLHISLSPGIQRTVFPTVGARLDVSVKYGSIFPDDPPREARLHPLAAP